MKSPKLASSSRARDGAASARALLAEQHLNLLEPFAAAVVLAAGAYERSYVRLLAAASVLVLAADRDGGLSAPARAWARQRTAPPNTRAELEPLKQWLRSRGVAWPSTWGAFSRVLRGLLFCDECVHVLLAASTGKEARRWACAELQSLDVAADALVKRWAGRGCSSLHAVRTLVARTDAGQTRGGAAARRSTAPAATAANTQHGDLNPCIQADDADAQEVEDAAELLLPAARKPRGAAVGGAPETRGAATAAWSRGARAPGSTGAAGVSADGGAMAASVGGAPACGGGYSLRSRASGDPTQSAAPAAASGTRAPRTSAAGLAAAVRLAEQELLRGQPAAARALYAAEVARQTKFFQLQSLHQLNDFVVRLPRNVDAVLYREKLLAPEGGLSRSAKLCAGLYALLRCLHSHRAARVRPHRSLAERSERSQAAGACSACAAALRRRCAARGRCTCVLGQAQCASSPQPRRRLCCTSDASSRVRPAAEYPPLPAGGDAGCCLCWGAL